MVFGGIQAFNLVSIILLILPGLAGTKLYLREVNRQDRFGRLDTIVISIAGSLGGLFVIYLWYWIFLSFENCVSGGPFPAPAPVWADLKSHVDALSEQIFHYAALILVVSGTGHTLGSAGVLIEQLPAAPNKAWRTLFEAADKGESDKFVQVVTTDGDRIAGEVDDWSVDSRDVVLRNPERLSVSGSTEIERVDDLGETVYIHEQDLSRIYFEEPSSADEASISESERTGEKTDEETEQLEEAARLDTTAGVVADVEANRIENDRSDEEQ